MIIPVIDIEKTSIKLRELREERKIKISQLQTLFNMTNPQSIYNWENPDMKNLPRIDNLVILAKFYNVKIDELIVLRNENQEKEYLSERKIAYNITKEVFSFIKENTSPNVLNALELYYSISI